ncbi:hypothetical protein [Azospirillum endophyticum]
MNLEEAKGINSMVRDLFKNGTKSCNKIYASNQAELDEWNPDDVGTKEGRRNNNAKSFLTTFMSFRDNIDNYDTAIEYGEFLFNLGGEAKGNCTEMACVAAYFAKRDYNPRDMRLVVTDDPGDHAFLVIGETKGWNKIKDPSKLKIETIIIDPWANVCCYGKDYPIDLARKMDKWIVDGKHILGKKIMTPKEFLTSVIESKVNSANPVLNPPNIF